MEPFARLGAALNEAGVRFVTIGANLWARSGHTMFTTRDYDLFLPPDPENALRAWQAADAAGLDLFCGDDPLDLPRDRFLAERIVERRSLVRATDGAGFDVDFALVLCTIDFGTILWHHAACVRRIRFDSHPRTDRDSRLGFGRAMAEPTMRDEQG